KDVDFDFHFGSHETVKHIYQDQPKDFSEIKIDIKNGSIELTPWENDYVQVDCDVKVYKVKDSEEARRQFLTETRFDIISDTLTFQCDTRDIKVNAIVSVPQKMYDSIDCKLFNGSMEGRRLQT